MGKTPERVILPAPRLLAALLPDGVAAGPTRSPWVTRFDWSAPPCRLAAAGVEFTNGDAPGVRLRLEADKVPPPARS